MTTQDDRATFTLKLTEIDLEAVHPKDLGALLENFSEILGEKNLKFGSIYQGSTVLEVCADSAASSSIIQNIHKAADLALPALKELRKTIAKYAKSHPNIQANIWVKPNAYSESQIIYTVDYQEIIPQKIVQEENIIGTLVKSERGKDDTDHIAILLHNEAKISVKINKELSKQISPYLPKLWNTESLIEFHGIAKYEIEGFNSTLKEFVAKSFQIIDNNQDIAQWANEFVGFGRSGWQELDNPIQTWLLERN